MPGTRATSVRRRSLVLAGALGVAIAVAGSAQATSYRYWTYWWARDGAWSFATAGAGSSLPADGSVEGWRFGIASLAASTRDAPAISPADAFAQACGSTPASPERKRVAVVIDPGSPAQAPPGERPGSLTLACASVEPSATGYQVLRSLTGVRTQDGLVCAIGGYPSVGCAEPVDPDAPTAAATPVVPAAQPDQPAPEPEPEPAGPGPMPLVVAGLAIGAMLGFIWRRRRSP